MSRAVPAPPISPGLPALLTPTEAFSVARIGRTLGYRLIREGAWPSTRAGRRILIPTAALLRVLGVEA